MAAGDLITNDFEIEYRSELLGGSTGIEIVEFDIWTINDVRTNDLARPLDHGYFSGTDYYSWRSVTMQLEAWATDDATLKTLLDDVSRVVAVGDDEEPLVVQLPGYGKLLMNARPRRRVGPRIDQDYNMRVARMNIEFFATDPRIYSGTLSTALAQLVVSSPGLTFDATFDLSFGGVSESGIASCVNDGTFETRPLIRIYGPIVNPTVENITQDKIMQFTGTVSAGDYLELDFLERTVLLNGSASRYSWLQDSTKWFTLQPGTNDIRLGGSTSGSPYADIEWRSAWI